MADVVTLLTQASLHGALHADESGVSVVTDATTGIEVKDNKLSINAKNLIGTLKEFPATAESAGLCSAETYKQVAQNTQAIEEISPYKPKVDDLMTDVANLAAKITALEARCHLMEVAIEDIKNASGNGDLSSDEFKTAVKEILNNEASVTLTDLAGQGLARALPPLTE